MSQSSTSQTLDADLAIEPFDGEPTEDSEILPLQNGGTGIRGTQYLLFDSGTFRLLALDTSHVLRLNRPQDVAGVA